MSTRSVVVGFDGSEESMAAVEWAADYASKLELLLTVVVAWHIPTPTAHDTKGFSDADLSAWAEALLVRACDRVSNRHPTLSFEPRSIAGSPGKALVDASETAGLLVVGTQHRLGSISSYCAHYSRCPVVIVRRAVT
jgi:nucleotide-binding universal stress UspA family protein